MQRMRMQRATTFLGALALMAVAAMPADAAQITGTVTHVHPASNIVKLNDGRTIYLKPGATFAVNGHQVTIDQIRPGMQVVVADASQAAPPTGATAMVAPAGHPPIDVSGTIARYDHQTQVLHFQDGRMVKLGPDSSVWQYGQHANLNPGARVLVRQAQPIGYMSAWNATTMPRHRTGSVVRVDPATAVVVLSDGTTVRVSPSTRMQMEGQTITLSQLRPGDEVVIVGTPSTAVSSPSNGAGMALPGAAVQGDAARPTHEPFYRATFDASDIHLMRRPQAP